MAVKRKKASVTESDFSTLPAEVKERIQSAVDCVLEALIKTLKENGADSFGLFLSQSKTKIPSPRQP
jgi:hypothetical protein